MGQRGKSAVKSLVCEFHKGYFLTNKTLEIYRKLVSERSANFYLVSVFMREFNCGHYNILHCLL